MNLRQLSGTPVPAAASERVGSVRVDAQASRVGTPPAAPAAPAANVQVSSAAAGSLAAAVSLPDQDPTDKELLSALKARIEAGEFHIDYGSLARSLVEDALQSIGRRR